MKKIYIALLLLAVVWSSCHNGSGNMTNKCGPCPLAATVDMLFMAMKLKIVDKATGNDLFLSPGSPYKPSDLNVTSSPAVPDYHLMLDTSDTHNRFVWLPDGQSITYTIKLASLSADHIKVVAGLDDRKCCAAPEVKSIMLNDSLVCAPCSNPQLELVIRK